MLKLIGVCLLFAGGAGVGISAGKQLKYRASALCSLVEALHMLANEMEFNCSRTGEMFAEIGRRTYGAASDFFASCSRKLNELDGDSFAAIWQRTVQEELPMLRQNEQDVLLAVGMFLGRYDAERQCRAVSAAAVRLARLSEEAEQEYRRKRKLYRTLGISAGGIFAVFLI